MTYRKCPDVTATPAGESRSARRWNGQSCTDSVCTRPWDRLCCRLGRRPCSERLCSRRNSNISCLCCPSGQNCRLVRGKSQVLQNSMKSCLVIGKQPVLGPSLKKIKNFEKQTITHWWIKHDRRRVVQAWQGKKHQQKKQHRLIVSSSVAFFWWEHNTKYKRTKASLLHLCVTVTQTIIYYVDIHGPLKTRDVTSWQRVSASPAWLAVFK